MLMRLFVSVLILLAPAAMAAGARDQEPEQTAEKSALELYYDALVDEQLAAHKIYLERLKSENADKADEILTARKRLCNVTMPNVRTRHELGLSEDNVSKITFDAENFGKVLKNGALSSRFDTREELVQFLTFCRNEYLATEDLVGSFYYSGALHVVDFNRGAEFYAAMNGLGLPVLKNQRKADQIFNRLITSTEDEQRIAKLYRLMGKRPDNN